MSADLCEAPTMEPQSPRSRSKAALTSARQPRLPAGCEPCEQFDLHVSKESLKQLCFTVFLWNLISLNIYCSSLQNIFKCSQCDSHYVDEAKGKSDLHQKSFSNNWQKNWMFAESWAKEQIWEMWVWNRVGHADASADAHRMRINAHRCASSAYWAKNEIPFFTYKLPFWLR